MESFASDQYYEEAQEIARIATSYQKLNTALSREEAIRLAEKVISERNQRAEIQSTKG